MNTDKQTNARNYITPLSEVIIMNDAVFCYIIIIS